MSETNGASGAPLMLAFLAGAVTGAVVAILASPQSGSETRESLRGWANQAGDKAVRVPDAVRNAYSRASVAAKDAFVEAFQRESDIDKAQSEPAEIS